MRLLFFIHQFPGFGGMESVTAALSRGFSKNGHEVYIYSYINQKNSKQLDMIAGYAKWISGMSVEQVLNTVAPELIIFQDSYANIERDLFRAIGCKSRRREPKVVVVEHNRPCVRISTISGRGVVRVLRYIKRPFLFLRVVLRDVVRRFVIYKHSTIYVLLSPRYIPLARRFLPWTAGSKFAAIGNPLTQEFPAVLDVGCKEKEVLYVGSLIPRKGVHRLLNIWSKVECKNPDWVFRIVGDGPEREVLQHQVKSLGLQHVVFMGKREDPSPFYAKASCLVLFSDFEGWPMVLGEAMSWGCVPVVADTFEAVYDIILNGVDGMIVTNLSDQSYVTALQRIIEDRTLRLEMSKAARSKARKFSLANIVAEWEKVFVRCQN